MSEINPEGKQIDVEVRLPGGATKVIEIKAPQWAKPMTPASIGLTIVWASILTVLGHIGGDIPGAVPPWGVIVITLLVALWVHR